MRLHVSTESGWGSVQGLIVYNRFHIFPSNQNTCIYEDAMRSYRSRVWSSNENSPYNGYFVLCIFIIVLVHILRQLFVSPVTMSSFIIINILIVSFPRSNRYLGKYYSTNEAHNKLTFKKFKTTSFAIEFHWNFGNSLFWRIIFHLFHRL